MTSLDSAAENLSKEDFNKEFFCVGKAHEEGITVKDVDPRQLQIGIRSEMEHTTSKKIATKIALDHLTEIPDYYTRLQKMEGEALHQ